MSKSPHDRALDVAARRHIRWLVCNGRPPRYQTDTDWPQWARGPILESVVQYVLLYRLRTGRRTEAK